MWAAWTPPALVPATWIRRVSIPSCSMAQAATSSAITRSSAYHKGIPLVTVPPGIASRRRPATAPPAGRRHPPRQARSHVHLSGSAPEGAPVEAERARAEFPGVRRNPQPHLTSEDVDVACVQSRASRLGRGEILRHGIRLRRVGRRYVGGGWLGDHDLALVAIGRGRVGVATCDGEEWRDREQRGGEPDGGRAPIAWRVQLRCSRRGRRIVGGAHNGGEAGSHVSLRALPLHRRSQLLGSGSRPRVRMPST